MKKSKVALLALILGVAIALMPIYFMFTLLQGILLFIAFAKMKKKG